MTWRIYLWGIGLASFVALVSFLTILRFVSPESGSPAVLSLLFLSLFLGLSGFFCLIGLGWRRLKFSGRLMDIFLRDAFGDGILLSLLVVGFLIMQMFDVFYWWSALIFFIIILIAKAVFQKKRRLK